MQLFLLAFIAVWIVVASIARRREAKELAKIALPMATAQKKGDAELFKALNGITIKVTKSHEMLSQMFEEEPPVEATRIYAALLRKGGSFRIHMLPATSVEDFHARSQGIVGPEWRADIIEYLDVVPQEKMVYVAPTHIQKKEMGVKQGLYFLQMAQEKFANNAAQKKAVEGIISNYKKTYELA